MLLGAIQKLNLAGCHAISFCGGFPSAPLFSKPAGVPTVPPMLDALIVLSATLRAADFDLEQLARSVSGPVVSVGKELPGFANIAANDEAAVFQTVAHLFKCHGTKKIAYIAGPASSADGERRFSAYRIALDHFGLGFDPALVVRGNYEAHSGREAVIRLRQQAPDGLDAIIAANDLMAIGALEGLHAAGIAVPRTVKVVGFDDNEESAFVAGGLTTVRQPIAEQGVAAAELAIRLLAGGPVEQASTLISAPLMIRRTCGCGTTEPRSIIPPLSAPGETMTDHALVEEALRDMIRKQLATRRQQRELSRMAEAVICAQDYQGLAAALTHVVRLLKTTRFLFCSYTANQQFARVTLESSGREVVFHNHAETFPVSQLLPTTFLKGSRPSRLFIEPLQLADEHFGYLVLEGPLNDGISLDVRHFLSAALSRISLTRELRRLYASDRKRGDVQRMRSNEPPDEQPSSQR